MNTSLGRKWLPCTVLMLATACGMNEEDARKELTSIGVTYGPAYFVKAAAENDVRAVELFLLGGIDPDVVVDQGIGNSSTALGEAISREHSEIVKLLIDGGADPTVGLRPAIVREQFGVVQMLLDAGADPSVGLHPAMSERDMQMVEMLLDAGADGMVGISDWFDRAISGKAGSSEYRGSEEQLFFLIDAWSGRGLEEHKEAIMDALSPGHRCSDLTPLYRGAHREHCEKDLAAVRGQLQALTGTP